MAVTTQIVRILGLEVVVASLERGAENLGEWDADAAMISVTEGPWKPETLWHEVLHAISDRLLLDLSEKDVTRIAAAQVAVLRDNPDLVGALLD